MSWVYGLIYLITNLVNGKRYVGQTRGLDPEGRWDSHRKLGRNGGTVPIHNAIRKYGLETFSFEVIWYASDKEILDKAEDYFMDAYNTMVPNGYNLRRGGSYGTHSEETLVKLRLVNLGRKFGSPSEETRKKISVALMGKSRGPNPMHSAWMTGKKLSAETRAKISAGNMGRKFSEETKAKIGNKHKGRKHTDISRRNMSDAHLGNVATEETKAKMSSVQLTSYATNPDRRRRLQELWRDPEFSDEMSRKLRTVERNLEKVRAASSKGHHTRWHIKRGITDPNCCWCDK